MSAKKKMSSKSFALQKRKNRRLLTFYRICRYGLESFARNSWLSVAAVAVMTVTLLIIFTAAASQKILSDTVNDLGKKVDMSVYLKTETPDKTGNQIKSEIERLPSVRKVTYISAEEARKQIAEANSDDPAVLAALNEATNKNPATLRVVVKDINDTSELEKFVNTNALLKKYLSTDYKPSFAGSRRDAIKSIGRAADFAQQAGIVASSVFVVISSLIIFNTIRMAIFNRKEEIQMMKLIGADQSFIRGPFLVEAIIYGLIAALIATAIGIFALYKLPGPIASYFTVQPTIDYVTYSAPIVLLTMIGVGALIGVISSLLATRRYLKI